MTLLAFLLLTLVAVPSTATEPGSNAGTEVKQSVPVAEDQKEPVAGGQQVDGETDAPLPVVPANKLTEGLPKQYNILIVKYHNQLDELFAAQRDHRLTPAEFKQRADDISRNIPGLKPLFVQISNRYSDIIAATAGGQTRQVPPEGTTASGPSEGRTIPPGGIPNAANPEPGAGDRFHPPKLQPLQTTGDELADTRVHMDNSLYRSNPANPAFTGNMGVGYYQNGNYPEAMRALDYTIASGKGTAEQFVAYGGSAFQLKDYETARAAAQKALELDPNNAPALAILKLAHDKPSEASLASALARVGLSKPNLDTGHAGGSEAFGAGDASRQAAQMGSAGGSDPVEQQRRAELAAEAARQQVVAPTKIQQSAAVTKEAARSLTISDYPGAYKLSTQAIALNSKNAQAWNYRAIADTKMQRYSDAVYDASYSINLEPNQAPPLVTRSWAFSKQGKYKEAERDARVALERAPENPYVYHDLAYALAGQGRRDEALAALRAASEASPLFKEQYQQALQLSENSDMTLLFADAPKGAAGMAGPAPEAPSRGRRFLRLFLLSISGGLIFALAILHVVSASWREKVNATIRRVLSSGEAPAAAAEAATQVDVRGMADGSAFWQQYEKVRELGAGGMGLVYEAVDKSLDRRVAVKRMRDEIRLDPGEKQRFIQEARMVAALHHPNIVDIYNIVEHDGDVFLVFEYVPGKTLSQRLDDGPLSFAEARAVLQGVCSAVDYAHKQKIIHRDIKPSNIMIRDDGAVKVMDFGVARQAKDAMTKMSMTNTVVGTPPYMAPEQEQGTVRLESDVFALGVVLYESLTGELPFQGVGAGMLLNKINGKHEVLSKKAKQAVPPGLDEIVAKALHPDADKRYKTPGELMAAVDALPVPSADLAA